MRELSVPWLVVLVGTLAAFSLGLVALVLGRDGLLMSGCVAIISAAVTLGVREVVAASRREKRLDKRSGGR